MKNEPSAPSVQHAVMPAQPGNSGALGRLWGRMSIYDEYKFREWATEQILKRDPRTVRNTTRQCRTRTRLSQTCH